MSIPRLSAREFYYLSQADWNINKTKKKNELNPEEQAEQDFFIKNEKAMNKDWKPGISYEEYLKYLDKSNNNLTSSLEIQQAGLIKNLIRADDRHPVTFYDDGALRSGYLVKNQRIQIGKETILCRAGSQIVFHENGQVAVVHLVKDQMIQGVKCSSSDPVTDTVSFYPNGQLRFVTLSEDQVISSRNVKVPCRAGGESVQFHNNGQISYAVLSANLSVKNVKGIVINCKPGDTVEFDENGFLISKNLQDVSNIVKEEKL